MAPAVGFKVEDPEDAAALPSTAERTKKQGISGNVCTEADHKQIVSYR